MPAADGSLPGITLPPPTQPRLRLWFRITIGLWLTALAGILLYAWGGWSQIAAAFDVLVNNDNYNVSRADFMRGFFANSYDDTNASVLFRLYLTGWGLAALIKLARLTPVPANWTDFHDFTWLVLCVVAVAGFPLMALCSWGVDAMPAGWVVDITRLLLTPVLMPFAGLASIAALGAAVAGLFMTYKFLFLHLPLMVFEFLHDRDIENWVNGQKKRGLADHLVRFDLWLKGKPLPDFPDDSKGARFATARETAARHRPDAPESMRFGHAFLPAPYPPVGTAADPPGLGSPPTTTATATAMQPLALTTDKHVLIMASTRSGKGVTLIIPHLLRYRGSAFVLDPKGENAKATSRQRAMLNGQLHVLDPFGITGLPQSRFNPLARFTTANMEAESKALAAALFVVGDRERDHWTAAGQQLLAAIILYVYVSSDIPPEKKDLPTVRRILLGGLKDALNAMTLIDEADGLLRDLAVSFLETPEKEFGSVVSTAQRQTEILDNPFMTACLAASGPGEEVDFKAWHSGTMTVYLCLSAPKFPTFNRWLRLVLTAALDEMTDTLDPPALPVCFLLDELATLGHLASVENAVGLAAGYGIQLVSVFQDIAQMKDLYKGRWASFVGNAGIRALFNLDDLDTARYWSDFIGGRLTETRSRQQDIYGLSKGDNVGEAMRPLLAPEELMMEFAGGATGGGAAIPGKMLILAQGAHPIITDRVPYWQDASLAGLWDDPRQPVRRERAMPGGVFGGQPTAGG